MTTFLSIFITDDNGNLFADGAATPKEVAAKVAEFAARGTFRLELDEAVEDAVAERLSEEQGAGEQEPDESMDGDHQSALASIGWGDDEDYRPGQDVDEAALDLQEGWAE